MTANSKRVLLNGGLFVAAVVITALIPIHLSHTFVRKYGDAMDWWSWWLAGRHSVNCGSETSCGLNAWAQRRPFRVRYDIREDYPLSFGLVRTPKGRMLAVSFVGDASGGEGTSFWGERVDIQSCPEPADLYFHYLRPNREGPSSETVMEFLHKRNRDELPYGGTVMELPLTVISCSPAEPSYPPDHSRLDRIIQDLRNLLDE